MSIFEEKCKRLKIENPKMDEASIQSQIKENVMKDFQNMNPKEGRQLVKASNILLIPNWDIVDDLVLSSISSRLTLQDQNKEDLQGTTFIEDQDTLVSWSLRRGSRATSSQLDESGLMGNIIVRRDADTSHVQEAHMNVDYSQFFLATTKKEKKGMIVLQNNYEAVVDAYNKEVKRRIEHENKLKANPTRPIIIYPSRPHVETFKSTPIIEIPNTPKWPQFYIAIEFEEEKNQLYALHVELNDQYQEKLR